MADEIGWLVGIDWASESHQVCLLDARGQSVGERSVRHGGGELCGWLAAQTAASPASIAVALEVPHGPVVEALLERGFQVSTTAGKQPWPSLPSTASQVGIHGFPGLFGDLEPDRPANLSLLDRCPLDGIAVRRDVFDPEPHQIAGSELAVDCQIEESQVAAPAVELQTTAAAADFTGARTPFFALADRCLAPLALYPAATYPKRDTLSSLAPSTCRAQSRARAAS